MIDINYLKQLLEVFDSSTVNELRIEEEGTSIKLSKSARKEEGQHQGMIPYPFASMPMGGGGTITAEVQHASSHADNGVAAPEPPAKNYHEIRSPIVGTFYRSPSPDTPTYVEVGSQVSPGAVLCIVEAMKLMNEIECDSFGKIAKIMVDNGQPVEYNQLLFLIEPQ
jgi:acetyl-CoA carboxylase biotin carboxyl carrier protein